jgi:hypothetical protein
MHLIFLDAIILMILGKQWHYETLKYDIFSVSSKVEIFFSALNSQTSSSYSYVQRLDCEAKQSEFTLFKPALMYIHV